MSHFISSLVLIREISYIININSVVFTWLLHRVQYYSYNICWLVVSNFFIFHNIWDNHSHWLSHFSRWLKTTNQYIYTCITEPVISQKKWPHSQYHPIGNTTAVIEFHILQTHNIYYIYMIYSYVYVLIVIYKYHICNRIPCFTMHTI